MSQEQESKYNTAYPYNVTNQSETISQALANAVRSKRSNMGPGPGIVKVEPCTRPKIGLSGSISQFLAKLWRLVNDEDTDDKICWSEDGHSFIVKDQSSFSMELLPRYFKHHNFSSFVRQLNMYGFRKVVNTEHGGLRCVNDEYQFVNKNFSRDHPELLEFVKRKPSSTTHPSLHHSGKGSNDNIATSLKKVLAEVHHLRKDNDRIKQSFEKIKDENTKLFNEVENLNEKNNNQSVIIQKIIKFIWSLVHQQNSLNKHQPRMMIENGEQPSGSQCGEVMPTNWTDDPTSQPASPATPRSPSKYGERVGKVGSDLQSLQNLLSQNFAFDTDVVNDLFEYNSEYMSPAMSPSRSYNGSRQNSPGPSGVNPLLHANSAVSSPHPTPRFNVQVEQYPNESAPSPISMSSPSFIQHPTSPVSTVQRQTTPTTPIQRQSSPASCVAGSPLQHQRSVSPVGSNNSSVHLSPHVTPHVSPYVSPHMSPHVSPHVSPHISPHASPTHSASYQQMPNYPVANHGVYPQSMQSPVRQYSHQFDQYSRSPGKQQYPYINSDTGVGISSEHVVKKAKLSSYTQNIQWDDEEYEEEEETKLDPSAFFAK